MNRIVCVSESTAALVRAFPVDPSRIVVIPCGIRIEEPVASAERDPHLILSIGRLVPRKGIAWFIEYVMPEVVKARPESRLIIIGNGPERVRIEKLIRQLNLSSHIELRTAADDEMCDALMKKATVFVMPNVYRFADMEGFGIVCIEAASRGLQVCAASINGIPDAVMDGKTGRLFVPGDAQRCINTLLPMMDHPLTSADVAMHARSQYSWDRIIPLYTAHVFN